MSFGDDALTAQPRLVLHPQKLPETPIYYGVSGSFYLLFGGIRPSQDRRWVWGSNAG